ncbi:DUF6817 domain-containing protein [Photorhabdus heterorhabditis]|uniref:DUF6817 domain-containing protein n=1 Tax=Photorhabdus heterorhabditis TaxID=880156 RepID=UPI0006C869CD|nr:hypothetical protein [Photorhabdus heterorhabditis]MBS9444143.1 hypothetical protein [Photorhabdus heterorhabditis]
MSILTEIKKFYQIDKDKVYDRHHSSHLVNTAKLLNKYGCKEVVCNAGMLHSIYDENSIYNNSGVSYKDREHIQQIVGKDVELLVYYYGRVHYAKNYDNISKNGNVVTLRAQTEDISIPEDIFSNLVNIIVADILEQIIWCVEKKGFFTYQDAREHLKKLFPILYYCCHGIKIDFNRFWSLSCRT